MLTGANGSLGAILPYCLEPNGVDLGTVGWLTVIPEHMTAATWGAFEQHDRPLVRLKFSEEAHGGRGALSREGPCGRGQVGSTVPVVLFPLNLAVPLI